MHQLRLAALLLAVSFPLLTFAQAGSACPASPPLPPTPQQNLFTEELEIALGDIIAERFERNFNVIEGELNEQLQRIADRLTREMPPSKIPIRVRLVDLPEVNAYAFPGGRVYVSRKLVVAARTEDEVAGVIAHEIGHIIARQSALRMSDLMRKVLGVTSLKDRADVVTKYHLVIENAAKKRKAFETKESHETADQVVADTVAIYGVARAGFRTQAYYEFWDRHTENQGKTGNAFSDFFGATKPASKRLREMLKYANSLPPACTAAHGPPSEQYAAWRLRVIENESRTKTESLPGLVFKKELDNPIRSEIRHLRFSPDKKSVIAQDDANIYVLTFEPFKFAFRIKAKDAYDANFSADSKKIVFHDEALRVEEWDLASRKRSRVHEIARRLDCLQSKLSYDGRHLGCWNQENVLQLIDVEKSEALFSQKDFFQIETVGDYSALLLSRLLGRSWLNNLMTMEFTPDSKVFAAAHGRANFVWNIESRSRVDVSGRSRKFMEHSFSFVDNNKMLGAPLLGGDHGELVTFPEGKTIYKFPVGAQRVFAPTRGEYVVLRPVKQFPVGVIDLAKSKYFLANSKSALDIYDDHYLSERKTGEVGLYDRKLPDPQMVTFATLPKGDLSRVRAFAISPDLKWLALSETNRGNLWNLETGKPTLQARGFRGAAFVGADRVVLDFPPPEAPPDLRKEGEKPATKSEKEKEAKKRPRQIVNFSAATGQPLHAHDVEQKDDDSSPTVNLMGDVLFTYKGGGRKGKDKEWNVTFEVTDPANQAPLWSRNFPKEAPDIYYTPWEGRIMFAWRAKTNFAKDEMARDSALSAKVPERDRAAEDILIQVVESKTGKLLNRVFLKTGEGSFGIRDLDSAGDFIMVRDTAGRYLIFSMSSGEIVGRFFGSYGIISGDSQVVIIENTEGQLSIYKFSDLENRAAKLDFPSSIAGLRFAKNNRLFVLTDDQTAYAIDLAATLKTTMAAK